MIADICECIGLDGVGGKVLGSRNVGNVIHATFAGALRGRARVGRGGATARADTASSFGSRLMAASAVGSCSQCLQPWPRSGHRRRLRGTAA